MCMCYEKAVTYENNNWCKQKQLIGLRLHTECDFSLTFLSVHYHSVPGQKPPRQKPPGHKPLDKNPLDKNNLAKNPPDKTFFSEIL